MVSKKNDKDWPEVKSTQSGRLYVDKEELDMSKGFQDYIRKIMNSDAYQKIFGGKVKKDLSWKEDVKWREENRIWLNKSFAIALAIKNGLDELEKDTDWLAYELNMEVEELYKILKGDQDLSLSQIGRFEEVLNKPLLEVQGVSFSTNDYFHKKPTDEIDQ